ncbi:MAG: hypothetical protein U1E46_18400 [Hyphomicrobiales bacterium]
MSSIASLFARLSSFLFDRAKGAGREAICADELMLFSERDLKAATERLARPSRAIS